MRKVLYLFGQLTDSDVDWLVAHGTKKVLPAGAVLISEGVRAEALYILLEGEVNVHSQRARRAIARLGPGEVAGEMSFIDARPPSATVTAATDVTVFAVLARALHGELESDVGFAARFYRALAIYLSDRVRRATAEEVGLDPAEIDELDETVLDTLDRAGARFTVMRQRVLESSP